MASSVMLRPAAAEPPAPGPVPRLRRARRRPGPYAGRTPRLVYGGLVAVLLGSMFPLWWAFVVGSLDQQAVNAVPPPVVPGGNFLANAATVIDTTPFWRAFGNSVIVAGVTAASVTFFSTLAGYAFAKLRFRGRNGLLVFVVATMAVPVQLGIVPLFIVIAKIMKTVGLSAGLWTVILPGMVSAFGVFWMAQYLRDALPDELIEAARVDGCSMLRTFVHVALPAARPAAAMLALFTFVSTWTNFFWPFIVLDPGNPTLPVALQQLQAAYFVDYSLVLAGVVLATVPLIALFVVAGRQLVTGIMAGAVKG